jgi:hypothetical protein
MKTETQVRGIGFFGLLGIVFITLKLTNVIDWHWAFVLAPLYVPTLIFIVVLFVVVTTALIVSPILKYLKNKG